MPRHSLIYGAFVFFILANLAVWFSTRHVQAAWGNVPPPPGENSAAFLTIGDKQLAFRSTGLMLQSLGSVGGRMESLQDYDYARLGKWFSLSDSLDPVSNFMPMLAAYYYGASQNPETLDPVIDYLEVVGQRPDDEKWRWLAHAVYLAKDKQKDNEKALKLSYELAANKNPDMAIWAKQMPAFILRAEGKNEAAYTIMVNILLSSADKLHPNEVNYMRDYICNTLLDKSEAGKNPLCADQ